MLSAPAIIPLMTSAFRYNKKQPKKYRRRAKAASEAADKLAAKGIDPQEPCRAASADDSSCLLGPQNPRGRCWTSGGSQVVFGDPNPLVS